MTDLPPWLTAQLRCPRTGVPLEREEIGGRAVYSGYPDGRDPVAYRIENGVPILLPQEPGQQ